MKRRGRRTNTGGQAGLKEDVGLLGDNTYIDGITVVVLLVVVVSKYICTDTTFTYSFDGRCRGTENQSYLTLLVS